MVFRGDGTFKVWMFHIARNVSHDQFKKDGRIEYTTNDIENWEEKISMDDSDTDEKEIKDKLLYEALEMMEADKKELLVMSKLKGVKYKEIAELLGITEGNVKIRVFRALGDLKLKMHKLNVNYKF